MAIEGREGALAAHAEEVLLDATADDPRGLKTGAAQLAKLALRGHEAAVRSAAFSPDGSRIVTASNDGTARLWDAASRKELVVLRGHEGVVRSAAFSPDGSRIVTASGATGTPFSSASRHPHSPPANQPARSSGGRGE
jgi:WD40 repeat protein